MLLLLSAEYGVQGWVGSALLVCNSNLISALAAFMSVSQIQPKLYDACHKYTLPLSTWGSETRGLLDMLQCRLSKAQKMIMPVMHMHAF